MDYLILNAKIVNEGRVYESDIYVKGRRIERIDADLQSVSATNIIDATGLHVFPGVIDDQVHFREPGLTHKGNIYTESRAAVAGGVTSYMEMPNTIPPTFTQSLLADKYKIAERDSLANYSFYMGTSHDNFEEIMKTNLGSVCGLKIFMGSSTGDLLVDDPKVLERIFSNFSGLIASHCEDEQTIRNNLALNRSKFGEDVPMIMHPQIRSVDACYLSSSFAISLAKKHKTRLHILHISTGKETELFASGDVSQKHITAEACIHHLTFTDQDYEKLGSKIKWNPAIKSIEDQTKIWQALLAGKIDVVATDHAPHTMEEKGNKYFNCPSGGPLVQHSLVTMIDHYFNKKISLETIVEKMCHAPSKMFKVIERGFVREGYYADLAIVDLNKSWQVGPKNILAKCGWSPFEDHIFKASIEYTFVSGGLLYSKGKISNGNGMRLEFNN